MTFSTSPVLSSEPISIKSLSSISEKIVNSEKPFLPLLICNNYTSSEPFFTGGQPDDERIIVEESTVHAPYYTEGESFWRKSTIIIDGVRREDDGLYECQAENEGGRFYKSGHITVEFGPTFEDQLYKKEWSWDQRPIKLSCIGGLTTTLVRD